MTYSVVIPVFKNEESLTELIGELSEMHAYVWSRFAMPLEAIFVLDGSSDESASILEAHLPNAPFRSQLLLHSRNFGSYAAIRTELRAATGTYFGMMAADLQDPPELLTDFLKELTHGSADIVVGVRESRSDPMLTQMSAGLFWRFYKMLVMGDIPEKGVDLFACNIQVRDELLKLDEAHSSLVGLLYWVGFRRSEVAYSRRPRKYGHSAWTFRKKFDYLLDSVFAFTDFPIQLLTWSGLAGLSLASIFGLIVLIAKIFGNIEVPGYTATILVVSFFGALNTLGIGLLGHYAWRTYENTKRRPIGIIRQARSFKPAGQTSNEKTSLGQADG